MQRRDQPGVGTSDSWIVEQCAAYLDGTYRQLLERRGHPVPAWSWINVLAHGDDEEFRRCAAAPVGTDDCDGYVARLARHMLLKMRAESVSLRDVQNTVLVPLEMALIVRVGSATPEETTLSRAVARELLQGLTPIRVQEDRA